MSGGCPPWPSKTTEKLIQFQDEMLPIKEIARRMGMNKNQVIGKLYRLDRCGIRGSPYNTTEPTTTMQRLQALHDMMDLVLGRTGEK